MKDRLMGGWWSREGIEPLSPNGFPFGALPIELRPQRAPSPYLEKKIRQLYYLKESAGRHCGKRVWIAWNACASEDTRQNHDAVI